jgi:hypothetical protein
MTTDAWYPAEPLEVSAWLRGVDVVWWIAGGWAIDLHLERVTRNHTDADVGILYRDASGVLGALTGWEFFEAKGGTLTELPSGAAPRSGVSSLWGRHRGSSRWELEIMLDQADADDWVYRRAPQIRRPLAETLSRARCGIRYLAPEIQLLYKSKVMRPCDEDDFRATLPALSTHAREWLKGSLAISQPAHRWIAELEV